MNSVVEKACKLISPKNYFKGMSPPFSTLPKEILFFSKRKKDMVPQITFHHRYLVIVSLSGRGDVVIDQYHHRIDEGKCILVHPFQCHNYILNEVEGRWLFIGFEADGNMAYLQLKNKVLKLEEKNIVLLDEMLSICLQRSMKQKQEDLPIFLQLFLNGITRLIPDEVHSVSIEKNQIIFNVIRYVEEHICQRILIQDIAEYVHLSESHLRKFIRDSLGTSLGYLIRKTKINKACGLLQQSDMKIQEVSRQCGYDSRYTFSRAFKEMIGVSPKIYRRK